MNHDQYKDAILFCHLKIYCNIFNEIKQVYYVSNTVTKRNNQQLCLNFMLLSESKLTPSIGCKKSSLFSYGPFHSGHHIKTT